MRKLLIALLLQASLLIINAGHVYASVPNNTLTVTPAMIESELIDQSQEKSFIIGLENSSDTALSLNVSLQSVEQENGRLIPLKDPSPLNQFMTLSSPTLTVEPHTSSSLTLSIKNDERLSPGGSYGALVFAEDQTQQTGLSLNRSISVPIFIIKRDGAIQSFDITEARIGGNIFSTNRSVSISVSNSGNVPIIPIVGVVADANQQTLSRTSLNSDSRRLIPHEKSSFEGSISTPITLLLPARITTTITIRGSTGDSPEQLIKNSWYIPPAFLVLLFIAVLLIIRIFKKLDMQPKAGAIRIKVRTESTRKSAKKGIKN